MKTEEIKESKVKSGPFQAIETRYIGPGDVRGSRVKATSGSGVSIILSWDPALGSGENHENACKALVDKLNWGGSWIGGGTKRGETFVQVD